jgi:hypothetical protein
MKTLTNKIVIVMASAVFFCAPEMIKQAQADPQLSATVQINARTDFEAPLAPEGAWVEISSHGRCWHPRGVAVGWRPYCDGEWVWTDCGWYWESDEPWAWACYHYGTWMEDPVNGWVWVPDTEWAPAWVEWRTGGDYIGWAPCAPAGVVVAPDLFAFVETGHFHDHIGPTTVVFNNPAIINQTTRMAEFKHETRTIDGRQQRIAINDGPGVAAVEKATGRKENVVPVQQVLHSRPAAVDSKPAARPAEPGQVQRPVALPDKQNKPDPMIQQHESPPANREPDARPAQPVQPPVVHPTVPPPPERHVTPAYAPRYPIAPPRQPVVPPHQPVTVPQPDKSAPPREVKPEAVPHEEKPVSQPHEGGEDKDRGRGGANAGGSPARMAAIPATSTSFKFNFAS